jgi:CHAD domain-containing protein
MVSSFSLDPAVAMSEAVRRVACSEVYSACAALAVPPDRHKGVHDARKCLKRLRSLLVLIRPGLPEPVYASLVERLRTVARGLAPARDAHALLDAINKLFGDAEDDTEGTPIPALRSWLRERRHSAARSLESSAASDAIEGLTSIRPAVASLAVYPDGFQSVAKGLRQSYRGGRRALAKAFANGSDEDFHEWRKTLQHHWRHMQLLNPCWPSELSARVELSRSLSQILGDDHDIAMLQHLISAPTMSFASPDATTSFLKQCRSRQKALRRDAKMLGERLFAERSGPFAERIEAYWLTAAQATAKPAPVARTGNVVAFGEAGAAGRRSSG